MPVSKTGCNGEIFYCAGKANSIQKEWLHKSSLLNRKKQMPAWVIFFN
jgi:hypothetical protein